VVAFVVGAARATFVAVFIGKALQKGSGKIMRKSFARKY